MGRRNTAKTGDKAIYKSRPTDSNNDELRLGDDEFMQIANSSGDDSVGDEGSTHSNIPPTQNVMDLGVEEESDSSDDISANEDRDDLHNETNEEDEDSYGGSSSAEEDDSSLENNVDSSRWGKKKSMYYHGDTADIEIGQEKEDAFDEEEAAKEIESSRFQVMDDDDFMADDTSGNDEDGPKKAEKRDGDANITATRELSNFSSKAKRRFIRKQHPELLPLVAFFSDVCKDCKVTTHAANALLIRNGDIIKSVGATKEGQQYLLTKSILGTSSALNAAIFLLLKQDMEGSVGERKSLSSIQSHPVMAQLQKCMVFDDALKQGVGVPTGDIEDQISYLIQAIAMMEGESGDQESDASTTNSDAEMDTSVLRETPLEPRENDEQDVASRGVATETVSPKATEREDYLMNEAKFGLRASEVEKGSKFSKRRKESADNYFGDLNIDEIRRKKHFLASTINTLEQKSRKERKRTQVEEIDETAEDNALAQGLNMMEEELRTTSDVDEEKARIDIMHVEENPISETRHPNPTRDFYSAVAGRSKERKAMKKNLYEVAPKFPGTVSEVFGERAISRAMMKNRGLVPHKAKINRNPRVKKREQYRKALISRKGAVREIRTHEGHKYSGEETGIKSGISRSRKL